MKRCRLVTAAATAAMVGILGFSAPAFAASGYGNVEVNTDTANKSITIGNDAFARTFSFKDGKLKTTLIDNKLGDTKIVPGDKSEEFLIEGMFEGTRQEPAEGTLHSVKPAKGGAQQSTVTVESSSWNEKENSPASNAIDGDTGTYWANREGGESTDPWLTIDFGREVTFQKVKYTPRHAGGNDGYHCTGQIDEVKLQKWDGENWVDVQTIDLQCGVDKGEQTTMLTSPVTATKVRLLVTKSYFWDSSSTTKYANIAEVDFFTKDGDNSVLHSQAQPAAAWTVEANSTKQGDGQGVDALLDGDLNTYWHCDYENNKPKVTPAQITIDRGDSQKNVPFQTVGYAGRKEGAGTNGNFNKFAVYASDTKDGLFEETNLKDTCKVSYTGAYDGGHKMVYCGLKQAVTGRYVGIKVLDGAGGFAAGAELDLFKEKFDSVPEVDGGVLKASAMELASDPVVTDTTATIQDVEKTGKLITFTFKPAKFGEGNATVELKAVMYNGDHFMRKWIEVKSEDQDIRIKYIDGEHLDLSGVDNNEQWTIPTNAGGVVEMDMQKSILGQPFYANGMFFGSEFPVADTQIMEDTGRARYWSGKNFKDFARDDSATYTGLNDEGEYVSWQTVSGATHANSLDLNLIQTDFYAYITSISEPSEFRIQYNSWFDNMMRINNENIIESFYDIDKNFSETGVRPIENYVVDDGWNQYRQTAGTMNSKIDIERNGPATEVNTAGFWQINSKFGGTLNDSSSLVKKLGSSFGVWIGPRGGYNYFGTLADIITKAGNGSKAGGSIDVADTRYVKKFEQFAIDMMEDYGVSYWKWDGFINRGQFGAFSTGENVAGYDESHRHMYGGPNGYFHVTDMWEKWCLLLSNVQDRADELGLPNFWISLTCYVNPSPWYLQFSNSVWMQCNADRGERYNSGELTDKMNAMLTYRDGVYYDFIKNHQFQFPLANVYNHDPIYGKEDTGITAKSMDGEQFRNYLFMQGTRGTAFWELYYSDSILDTEKYLVNADFLKWEEENFDMLRNAKVIGGTPAKTATLAAGNGINGANPATGDQNAYGFACFNNAGDEGIISMRNPAYSDKTIEFTLDNAIGCTSAGEYKVVLDHVYTEGDKAATNAPETVTQGQQVSMTLKPGETQIWHLTKDGDAKAPVFTRLYNENDTTLRVQTSEHVKNAAFEVTVDGKKVDAKVSKAYADLKTFDIKLAKAPAEGAKVEVKATAGEDYAGNKLTATIARDFHIDGIVARTTNVSAETIAASDASFEGPNGFTVTATAPAAAGTVLASQGDQWSLGFNAEGKAVFTVNGVTAASEEVVAGTVTISGVRENNGMLKVYVNGVLSGSQYDAKNVVNYSVKQADITAKAGIAEVVVYDKALSYDEVPASPLENLINTVEALKDKVTAESWTAANMDTLLTNAKEALKGTDATAQQKAYDELLAGYNKLVPGVGAAKTVNFARGKDVIAAWKSDDSNAANNNDMPVTKAVDGVKNTSQQYGEFGSDNKAESSYLQVDLGAVENVTSINLVRYYQDGRIYPNTTIVLSEDKNFDENDTVVYNSDAENKNGFGAGKDQAYAETSAGKTFDVKAGTQARYVRVYMNGNKRSDGTGNTNHIVELEVMGPEKVTVGDPFGIDALDALIARGKTAVENADKYTPESIDALKTKLAAAETLAEKVRKEIESGKFTTTYGEFNTVRDELQTALNNLVAAEPEPGVDKSALQAKYDEVKELKADDYKSAGWKTFARALAEAEKVLADEKADQATVDAAAKALADARAGLEQVEKVSFADVDEGTSHKDEVAWLAANGISKGWEAADGTFEFRPYETVRRADMAAFLYRLAGEPGLDAKGVSFADVDESTPHRDAILWLASEGISTGFEAADGKAEFRPYAEIARCDMAAFLYRMAGEPKFETDKGFADVARDTPHREAVLWLAETGVSEGWELEDGTAEFRPYDQIARADMAAFLQRMAEKDLVDLK